MNSASGTTSRGAHAKTPERGTNRDRGQVPDIGSLSISTDVVHRGRSQNDGRVPRVNIPARGRGRAPPDSISSTADVRERAGHSIPGQRSRELPAEAPRPSNPNLGQNSLRYFNLLPVPRAGRPGTHGRLVRLRTNHLPVQYTPNTLYGYHVLITPNTPMRSYRKRIYELAEQTTAWQEAGMVGTVAHDGGSRLVSSQPLPNLLEIQVDCHEEGNPASQQGARVVTMRITYVQILDGNALTRCIEEQPRFQHVNISPVVSALNLVQLTARGSSGVVFNGRKCFFFALHTGTDLGGGLEARRGFMMSLLPTRGGLMIRVNVGASAFYSPGNLAALILAFQSSNRFHTSRSVQHIRVETTHTQSRKLVRGFATQDSNTHIVDTVDFGRVTVSDYFTLKYGIRLRFPHLPLALVGTRSDVLPPELCVILPQQPCRKKMPCDARAVAMTNFARVYPNANGQTVRQLAQQPPGPVLSSFGMNVGTDLLEVTGRVLPAPAIIYSANTVYVDDRLRAQWDIGEARFVVGGRLDQWTVLVIKDNPYHAESAGVTGPALTEAVSAFRDMCDNRGIAVTEDPTYTSVQIPHRSSTDLIREAAVTAIETALRSKPKPQLVMVVLADSDRMVYDGIKYLCDVVLDLPSMCVLSSKFRVPRPQYLSSLSLKLNIKLGGINHRLDAESMAWLNVRPTMVVGMGVTHPEPGAAMGTPSIAAVVASVDAYFAQYPASLSLQESGREMISDVKNMMVERLKLYQNRNGGELPERVLVYRSGISETQIDHLTSIDVPAIRDAFATFRTPTGPYRPTLMVVICRKSQRTWFWVDGAATDSDGNPEPGTVVDDSGVTCVYHFEFYLQAHGCARGTARPTLYTVVYDEVGASADDIQGATHALCYMYAPATHAVSLVAPAYYADLACKRGRCYLRKHLHGDVEEDGERAVWEDARRIGRIPGWAVSSTMFYV